MCIARFISTEWSTRVDKTKRNMTNQKVWERTVNLYYYLIYGRKFLIDRKMTNGLKTRRNDANGGEWWITFLYTCFISVHITHTYCFGFIRWTKTLVWASLNTRLQEHFYDCSKKRVCVKSMLLPTTE